ncbi:MAG: MBOAT family protein [Bacteroidales bacterium]|nr:MBOAT family protein [Bacteroidales bacterium]
MKEIIDGILKQLLYDPENPLLFNSGFFVYFLFFFILLYYAVRRHHRMRTAVFTLFSLYFFYKACGWFVSLILLSAVVDFAISNLIYIQKTKKRKTALLVLSLVLNLGLLFYFKYTNFFISIVNDLNFSEISPLNLILPIGISFYTFENLSYTIDVYRGHFKPVKSFLDYLFFLSFFPKLVMGPIVRAADFIPQIRKEYNVSPHDFSLGFFLIVTGLFKKLVISDYINVNYVGYIFDDPSKHTGLECLLGVYGYAMVIYCDFSGYSDVAIGLARWMGFNVNINFNSPYQSASITEFWRRWHISLSSWLRDYLYVSLGGNRKGKVRQYINLAITMLLGGLWHGASWNFIIWGGMHGAALALDKGRLALFRKIKETWYLRVLGVLFTFHLVGFTWIFFRASSLHDSVVILQQIWYNFDAGAIQVLYAGYDTVFLMMILGFALHFIPQRICDGIVMRMEKFNFATFILIFLAFMFIFYQIKCSDQVMPIYLQF